VTKLPKGVSYEWTGLSYEEVCSGSQAPALYAISLTIVFLCLAALYESWSIPFAVIAGGAARHHRHHHRHDLCADSLMMSSFKWGLLTTVGLSAKNAILIVEFRVGKHARGMHLIEATVAAARQPPAAHPLWTSMPSSWAYCRWRSRPERAPAGASPSHRRDRRHGDGHGARRVPCAGVLRERHARCSRDRRRHEEHPRPSQSERRLRRTEDGLQKHLFPRAAVTTLLGACTLEPHYQRPPAPVPALTRRQGRDTVAADIGWREFFPDPQLQQLIALALTDNRDLRAAALNVQSAQRNTASSVPRCFRPSTRALSSRLQHTPPGVLAAEFPSGAAGGAGASPLPNNGITIHTYDGRNPASPITSWTFSAASRSLSHAALQQYFSFRRTRRSVQLTLVAEVAHRLRRGTRRSDAARHHP